MPLIDYEANNDFFDARTDGEFAFPCCSCKYNNREDDALPCRMCGHNANANDATVEDVSAWMGMKSNSLLDRSDPSNAKNEGLTAPERKL